MIRLMTVAELKERIDKKEENLILIDCREEQEWESGHIPQALFMPLSQFDKESEKLTDKSATYILQCRSGARSMRACQHLDSKGFENLYNLEGGILAWEAHEFPIE